MDLPRSNLGRDKKSLTFFWQRHVNSSNGEQGSPVKLLVATRRHGARKNSRHAAVFTWCDGWGSSSPDARWLHECRLLPSPPSPGSSKTQSSLRFVCTPCLPAGRFESRLSLKEKHPSFDECFSGGEGGIRTHGNLTATPDFESGAFDHSATSP